MAARARRRRRCAARARGRADGVRRRERRASRRRRRRPTIRDPVVHRRRARRAGGAALRRRPAARRSEQPRRRRSRGARASASACSSTRRSRGRCSRATTTAAPATLGRHGEAGQGELRGLPRARERLRRHAQPAPADLAGGAVDDAPHARRCSRSAFAPLYNWDGRRDSIWSQAIGVMESEREFNSGRLFVAQQIVPPAPRRVRGDLRRAAAARRRRALPAARAATTPAASSATRDGRRVYDCRGKPGDGADYDGMTPDDQTRSPTVTVNAAKAIAAYVRQLRCGPGRFDALARRRRGGADRAPSSAARRCSSARPAASPATAARTSPTARSTTSAWRRRVVAVAFVDADDRGAADGHRRGADRSAEHARARSATAIAARCPRAVDAGLEGAFRTPTLRCSSAQPSFMHTGQMTVARPGRRLLRSRRRSRRRLPGHERARAARADRARARRSGRVPRHARRAGAGGGAAGGAVRRLAAHASRLAALAGVWRRRRAARRAAARARAGAADGGRRRPTPACCPTSRSPAPTPATSRRPAPAASTAPAFCDDVRAGPAGGRPLGRARSGALERRARPALRQRQLRRRASAWARPSRRLPRGSLERARAARRRRAGLRSDRDRSRPATLLATAAAQNYGLSTYRIRQPFDFAGRTGTIKLDVDLTQQRPRRLAGARDRRRSVAHAQLRLAGARLGPAQRRRDRVRHGLVQHAADAGDDRLHVPRLRADRRYIPSFDCGIPHATTAKGALNHVEVYLTQTHVEVWVSDVVARRRQLPELPAPVRGRSRAAVLARLRQPGRAQPRDDQVRLGSAGSCAGTTSASTGPS